VKDREKGWEGVPLIRIENNVDLTKLMIHLI
jgi:hypothetical protein